MKQKIAAILTILASINVHGDEFTVYEGRDVEVGVSAPASAIIIGGGLIVSDSIDKKVYQKAMNDLKASNYLLTKSREEMDEKLKNIAPQINDYLLKDTVKQRVYFKTGIYTVTEDEKYYLSGLMKSIHNPDNLAVYLVGHADARGDADYNLDLSKRRVNEIAKILSESGIEESQIEREYRGEAGKAHQQDVENYFYDRTVEIYISRP